MLNLYNKWFQFDHFSDAWGNNVIFLEKNKRKIISSNNSTTTVEKLLERLIKTRVVTLLGNISHLENAQSGFREGRSIVDAVIVFNLKSRNDFPVKNSET